MKSIYVLAVLAVVSLSIVPMMADESDASYSITYTVYGQEVAWGFEGDLNVPEVEPHDGERFIGWYCMGEIIDPYSYPFEDGIYRLVAGFEDVEPTPSPEPEEPFDWTPVLIVAAVSLAIVALVVYVFGTRSS